MIRKNFFIAILCFVTSCATQAKYEGKLNMMMGMSKRDLIDAWGPPNSTYKLDENTEYFTYSSYSSAYIPGSSTTSFNGNYAYTNYSGGYTNHYNCDTTFTIEKDTVTHWRYKGNNCVSR